MKKKKRAEIPVQITWTFLVSEEDYRWVSSSLSLSSVQTSDLDNIYYHSLSYV